MKTLLKFTILIVFAMVLVLSPDLMADDLFEDNNDNTPDYKGVEKPVYNSIKELTTDLPHIDKKLAQLFLQSGEEPQEPPLNSNQKIQLAHKEGKINREETALLSVLAAYDPEQLPEKYHSNQPSSSAQFEIRYLYDNWDSLSEETKETVIPYLVPINDPRSLYYSESKIEDDTSLFNFNFTPRAKASILIFHLKLHGFIHDGQKIIIMYHEENQWSEEQKQVYQQMMNTVEKALIHSWDKFKPLMKVKPSRNLIIEFFDYPVLSSIYGEQYKDGPHYRIRLSKYLAGDPELIKSVTAHELFHCFQDELKIGYDQTEEKWLCEATATWSQNYAYSKNNIEHEYHKKFFETLARERINFGNVFEYASYMLFYYLTDYGKTNIIQESIAHAGQYGNSSIRSYLENNIPQLKENYSRFAIHNWNISPFVKYNDQGPIDYVPSGNSLVTTIMPANFEDKQKVSLEKGGIKYYVYTFDKEDPELQHVIISFDSPIANDKYVKRKALIRIDGEWEIEDLSSETYREYCYRRKSANENIDMLVLIYSNASFTEKKEKFDRFEIRTEGCPKEMELTIKADFEYFLEDWHYTSQSQLTETLEIVDHCLYLVKNSHYQARGEGILEGKKVLEGNAYYNINIQEPDYKNSLARILKRTEGNIRGTEEAYAQFGIEDKIPPEGIFITLPAAMEENTLKGSASMYLPPPIGTMNFPMPLVIDGLGKLISFYPWEIGEWHARGIKVKREFNPFHHKTPIVDAFSVDNKKLLSELENLDSMPEMPDMPDMENMELPDEVKSMMGQSGDYMSDLKTIMEAMFPNESSGDIDATLKIKINGFYTRYNED